MSRVQIIIDGQSRVDVECTHCRITTTDPPSWRAAPFTVSCEIAGATHAPDAH